MASEKALGLKAKWMEMPEEFFETLSFWELEVEQRFISLPQPGDNTGHGGFRGAGCIFTKTHQRIKAAPGLPLGIATGKAVNNRGIPSYFLDWAPVILLI